MFKQVIVVRKDLGMRKGKMIAQGAHAALGAVKHAHGSDVETWELGGQTKIVVGIESEDGLFEIHEKASNEGGLPTSLVRDEGRTELEPGTPTAVAVGPAKKEEVDKYTGHLNLL